MRDGNIVVLVEAIPSGDEKCFLHPLRMKFKWGVVATTEKYPQLEVHGMLQHVFHHAHRRSS